MIGLILQFKNQIYYLARSFTVQFSKINLLGNVLSSPGIHCAAKVILAFFHLPVKRKSFV